MKQRILKLTPEELMYMLQGKPTQQLNLPIDIELIDIKYDAFTKQVSAVIRSDTFENVTEDTPTPELTHKLSTPQQPQITPKPTSNSDTTPKTSTTTQTNPATPQKSLIQTLTTPTSQSSSSTSIGTGVKTLEPKPEANIDTCGFEDEFTKEQHKVLRFISDGDNVLVKPTQFLKTEWEDINDTVKSIGGKWVKGAIDYWVIPKNLKKDE
jgi:hypothetical protein